MQYPVQKERPVNDELEKLLSLQVIDYDLGELERSKLYLPDMMDNLNRELDEARQKTQSAKNDREGAQLRQKQLELEVESRQADLQKYQQQMMSIKTNKEYDALVSQIDSLKSEIEGAETEILELIDRVGALDKEIEELDERLRQVEENNGKQLAILQQKVDSIDDKVTSKQSDREGLISDIPKRVLSVYERVKKGKGSEVVVVIRKRACGACHKALTPKKVQEIRRGDRIHTCDYCGRMLYWVEAQSA